MFASLGGAAAASTIAGGGYDSSYAGESVFTSAGPGETGQMSAIFFNAGTQPWAPGVVVLLVCLSDKTTCNVQSPNAAYASNWYTPTAYATVATPVLPGQNGFFVYGFSVPLGTPPGTTVTFNGDLGLAPTGALIHPTGYYQQNTNPRGTGVSFSGSFDVDPISADGVSTAALTVTVVDAFGRPDTAYFGGTMRIALLPTSTLYCRITDVPLGRSPKVSLDGSYVTVAGELAQVVVTSTTFPGVCSLSVTSNDIPAAQAIIPVTTRIVGPASKLGVSLGGSTTRPASLTGACSVGGIAGQTNDNPSCIAVIVDLQDINGYRIAADSTRVVTATLDPASCSGGAQGGVNISSGGASSATAASATVSRGRVTFVLASASAYAGCRVNFSAPGVAGATTTEVWTAN